MGTRRSAALILLVALFISIWCIIFFNRTSTHRRGDAPHGRTPLLVLFTSFKPRQDRLRIHETTVWNWASLGPRVCPVLFTDPASSTDELLTESALRAGWKLSPVPRTNKYGTPFFKDMFLKAMTLQKGAKFYGYSNGDILFDEALLTTLDSIWSFQRSSTSATLVVGQRRNVAASKFSSNHTVPTSDLIKRLFSKALLFTPAAIDFFFMSNAQLFPWDALLDVVIGRPGYDNYILDMAADNNVSLVDVTATMRAVHQTGTDGNVASRDNVDFSFNQIVFIKANYKWKVTCCTDKTRYMTIIADGQRVRVVQRV